MAIHEISPNDTPAVKAVNTSTGAGVWSNSKSGASIIGQSIDGRGVIGESNNAQGLWGVSHAKYHAGVTGVNDNQDNEAGPGVMGISRGTGLWGESETWNGVYGTTKSSTGGAGVYAVNTNPASKGAAFIAKKHGSAGDAGVFEGNVRIVLGDLNVERGLLKINGQSVWELISNLQLKIQDLEKKVAISQNTATEALRLAQLAKSIADSALINASRPR